MPLRALETLSFPMYASYKEALEAEAESKSPSITSLATLSFIYNSGYRVLEDHLKADKYLRLAALAATEEADKNFTIRGIFLSIYYTRNWNLFNPLDVELEISWVMDTLSRRLFPDIAVSAGEGSHFARLIKDAISVLNDESQRRTLTLWFSAYEIHDTRKSVPRFELRNRLDPQYRLGHQQPQWLKILLQDEPFAFEILLDLESLPSDLQLSHEPGRTNMIRFCAENMLPRILKHLIAEHSFNVEGKLDSGWTILQEAVEQGNNDRVFMLLDCGANAKSMVDKDFVKHITGDGSASAIQLWTAFKQISDDLVGSNNSNFLLSPHLRDPFFLFDEFDMSAQGYESSGKAVSPIYFSILENSWLTFAALLQFGINTNVPCMAFFNPLQTAVLLVRPLFVATLLETQPTLYKLHGLHSSSMLHLASLGQHCFEDERKWVYGREDEIKGAGANPQNDELNHKRIILELLLRQPNCELDSRDTSSFTPFLLAMLHGSLLAAAVLLHAGADPTLRTSEGFSAAHLATLSGDSSTVHYVASNWLGTLESRALAGEKPLHISARLGDYNVLETLLKYNPDLEALDMFGRTALQISLDASKINNHIVVIRAIYRTLGQETLQRLLNAHDHLGRSCYHSICKLRESPALKVHYPFIFSSYKPISGTGEGDWTPLHFAAVNAPHLIDYLAVKIDINTQSSHGFAPLHLAYMSGNQASIHALMQNGAAENIKDDLGRLPVDLLIEPQTASWDSEDITAAMDNGILKQMAEMCRTVFENTRKKHTNTSLDEEDPFQKMYMRDYIPEPFLYKPRCKNSPSAKAVPETGKCLFCGNLFPLDDSGNLLPCQWDMNSKRAISGMRSSIRRKIAAWVIDFWEIGA
jgi:ankyrin repeat protein